MVNAIILAVSLMAAPAAKVEHPRPRAQVEMAERQKAERHALAERQKAERAALREQLRAKRAAIRAEVERRMLDEQ